MDTFEVIGQLEAEALARADAGKLLLLFGGALATGQLSQTCMNDVACVKL